ncbi:22738_t:CDS:2 [Entrophospora sp. SA101]|nr:22738_t:CDS:2 [Entrophospora sp. SA101]CAJ0918848.1 20753_t:CDS:2 [Entrophospora sp. SA101]
MVPVEETNKQNFIRPRQDCPHVIKHENISNTWNDPVDASKPCAKCNDTKEYWLCLKCQQVFCSSAHMSEHNQETSHPLAISFSDMSVWCYECDYYIDSPNLKQIITACYVSKFGELPPNSSGIQILSEKVGNDSGATSSS